MPSLFVTGHLAAGFFDSEWFKLLFVLLFVGGLWFSVRIATVRRARYRLLRPAAIVEDDDEGRGPGLDANDSALRRWLFLAGFRDRSAPAMFVAAEALCALAALVLVPVLLTSDVLARGADLADGLPGGLGAAISPLYSWAPVLIGIGLLALPIVHVRTARRKRVDLVERDLPMTLELLASLAEAGQGLDSSIQRIIETQDDERPLHEELQRFRAESLSGQSRRQCYKNLAARLDVPAVSVFVSALTHAEEVGAGMAGTLRQQADELWSRRRENVMAQSQLLPTKLAVPLVVCFLPGILAVTVVPALTNLVGLMPR
jgi:tight adherence protein C